MRITNVLRECLGQSVQQGLLQLEGLKIL